MLDFKSEKERQKWVIDNAQYFTVVRFHNRRYERHEVKTLPEARALAHTLIGQYPGSRWLIYAVAEHIDNFVEVIQ